MCMASPSFLLKSLGSFKPGGYYGTVLKKSSEYEQEALRKLMTDEMKPFVPEFKRIVTQEDGSIPFTTVSQALTRHIAYKTS